MLFALVSMCSLALVMCGWETPLESTAKISAEARDQMSKDVAIASQRAFAPTSGRVANFLALEAQVRKACPKCEDKDFSDPCPLGWEEQIDGRCAAPSTYTGFCDKIQTFISSSVASKMELETSCEICWPCSKGGEGAFGTCARDWARPCPHGYLPQAIPYNEFREAPGITCAADLSYQGECEQQVIFKDETEKRNFVERCQTSWPCKRVCQDGFAECPRDWSSVGGGLCSAPDSYKVHGCPLLRSFVGWSDSMKSDFARQCSAEWMCSEVVGVDRQSCRQLNLSSCPLHWSVQDDHHCAPPLGAQGPCTEPIGLNDMSAEQKIRWASACGVEWQCLGEKDVELPLVAPRAPQHDHAEIEA